MPRLFVAAWADAAVRERALEAQAALRARGLALRFTAPEQLHATFAFLGSVEEGRTAEVERLCAEVAAGGAPFDVQIDRLGGYPESARATVAWLGSHEPSPAFRALARRLREALRRSGLPADEKDAAAHVTLGRAKTPVELPALDVAPTRWPIAAVALVESKTLPEGSRYVALRTWELGT